MADDKMPFVATELPMPKYEYQKPDMPPLPYTPVRANAEKMLPAFKLAQGIYCTFQCDHYAKDFKHTPECLNMQSIIAAAEGRGENK